LGTSRVNSSRPQCQPSSASEKENERFCLRHSISFASTTLEPRLAGQCQAGRVLFLDLFVGQFRILGHQDQQQRAFWQRKLQVGH